MSGPRDWALTLVAALLLLGVVIYGVMRLYA